jgi:hypothetical protein
VTTRTQPEWLLITSDGLSWLTKDGLKELLADPVESHGIHTWLTEIPENSHEYWRGDSGLLMRVSIAVPQSVTTVTEWKIP